MVATPHERMVNPRLGAYFGIFASLYVSIFLLSLIFEGLGADGVAVRFATLLGPLCLFMILGVASATNAPAEFLVAGRRVPAVYNGAVIAVATLGATSVLSITGLFYAHGFDAWSIVLGAAAGLVVMGTMIAPYFRKFGAYTLASFLGRRLESRLVRVLAAAVFILPIFLVLVAELRLAMWAARQLTGSLDRWMLAAVAIPVAAGLILGGARAASWSGTAQAIAVLIAVVVVVGIAGVWFTFLPVAQLSFGPALREVGAAEAALGVPIRIQPPLGFELASNGLVAITQRMAEPFGAIGAASFSLTTLTVLAGIASAPWLVCRCSMTPTVHAARKSLSWSVLFYGLVMVSLAAAAVFLRDIVLTDVVGRAAPSLPVWFKHLQSAHLADVTANVPALPPAAIHLHRDAALLALSPAAGFASIVGYLACIGAVAAATGAATATALALATTVAEDVVCGLRWDPPSPVVRLLILRIVAAIVITLAALVAISLRTDPLRLVLWALAVSASTAFPVTILAIWYKRLTPLAAAASLASGFGVSVLAIMIGEVGWFGLPKALAAICGLPVAAIVALVVSRMTPKPSRSALEHVRDMRIPGGETIYDREMRLMRLKQASV